MELYKEIERMFNDDVREKKRTGSGVFSKTGKRGYVGTMRMPSDIMSRKDKYNYRKNGKVESYNMYDSIMNLEQFKKLTGQEKKRALEYWLLEKGYTKEAIRKRMIVSAPTLDSWLMNFGIFQDAEKKAEDTPPSSDKILPIEEFKKLPEEERQRVFDSWYKEQGKTLMEIEEGMGLKRATLAYHLKSNGVTYESPFKSYAKGEKAEPSADDNKVLPYEEWSNLPAKERKRLALHWSEIHTNAHIEREMGIAKMTWRDRLKKFNIPYTPKYKKKPGAGKPGRKPKEQAPAVIQPEPTIAPDTSVPSPEVVYRVAEQIPNGLNLLFNETLDSTELMRRLKKIGLLIEDEPNRYKVHIRIEEVK